MFIRFVNIKLTIVKSEYAYLAIKDNKEGGQQVHRVESKDTRIDESETTLGLLELSKF